MVVCSSCAELLYPPGAKFCAWCGSAAPQWAGSLAEDREALRAMREVDAAIDTLLEKALANLKIEIDHELGGGNDTWVAVVGSGLKVPPAHVVRPLPPELLAEALPLKTLLPDGTQLGTTGELQLPIGDVGGR